MSPISLGSRCFIGLSMTKRLIMFVILDNSKPTAAAFVICSMILVGFAVVDGMWDDCNASADVTFLYLCKMFLSFCLICLKLEENASSAAKSDDSSECVYKNK